jgi:16S rRNA (cytosine967-C5)-methyltransferase
MAALQARMLDAAADVVVPGGILVYSTCSLEEEENEARVHAFLETHPDFRVEATDAVPARYLDDAGMLVVSPDEHGFDGAFAARLRRAVA